MAASTAFLEVAWASGPNSPHELEEGNRLDLLDWDRGLFGTLGALQGGVHGLDSVDTSRGRGRGALFLHRLAFCGRK